mmetsp:Transcript_16389/g.45420  ORF Transcript_16389/g.45420 Transcript_16389/m.45420 type:complete len:134 (+) Transcript_16389:560-961(+)
MAQCRTRSMKYQHFNRSQAVWEHGRLQHLFEMVVIARADGSMIDGRTTSPKAQQKREGMRCCCLVPIRHMFQVNKRKHKRNSGRSRSRGIQDRHPSLTSRRETRDTNCSHKTSQNHQLRFALFDRVPSSGYPS